MEKSGRIGGDGGRIDTPAQLGAQGVGGVEAAFDSGFQLLPVRIHVFPGVFECKLGLGRELKILPQSMRFRGHRERVGRGEFVDLPVRGFIETHGQMGQVIHHPLTADVNGEIFQAVEGCQAGSTDKAILGQMIVKRLDAHVVPSAENPFFRFIVNHEDEITDQMRDAILFPFAVASADEFGVADPVGGSGGHAQFAGQFLPIVDSGPGGAVNPRLGIMKRGGFQFGRGGVPGDALDHQDAVVLEKPAFVGFGKGHQLPRHVPGGNFMAGASIFPV